MRARAGIVIGALALLCAGAAAPAPSATPNPLRVLFVGNSLTATNDLPGFVTALASARGRGFEHLTLAPGGYSLEDHWNAGYASDALRTGSWDVVVMQQGPSTLRSSEANMKVWAGRFAHEARAAGTTPALLTVWPEGFSLTALEGVMGSYRRSARVAGATLLPAGDAWLAAWRCRHKLPLYSPDGFHPSRLGTYLAALVVYGRLTKTSPLGLPRTLTRWGVPFSTSPGTARLVQAAAASALGVRPRSTPRCG